MSTRQRREFLQKMAIGSTGLALTGLSSFAEANGPFVHNSGRINKIIILGIDGMDPRLVYRFVKEGGLPNFKKLMTNGGFRPLGTSLPPQSPVAWSNFITGMNPGGHGIFDFIHRDPVTFVPYLSTTRLRRQSGIFHLVNGRYRPAAEKLNYYEREGLFGKFWMNMIFQQYYLKCPQIIHR